MGYSTGTSTGPNDLLDKLRTFLIAEGWNVNGWTTIGLGYRLHVDKLTSSSGVHMYFNFRSAINEYGSTITEDNSNNTNGAVTGILINGSTSYSGAGTWDKEPGYCQNLTNESYACCMTGMSLSAIPNYWFFTCGDSVHVVVEVTSGKFQMMSFGCLLKQGLYTGGQYFTATCASAYPYHDLTDTGYSYVAPRYLSRFFTYNYDYIHGAVYLSVDSKTGWWSCSKSAADNAASNPFVMFTSPSPQKYSVLADEDSLRSWGGMFWLKSPNFYNNIAALCPSYIFARRSDVNYSLLGWPEGVRSLNVLNYSAGQELTYGTETWKVFPADGLQVAVNQEYAGFAYLKVT